MLNWMIFRSMETRLLVGITAFVGLMVLVGWVAINEEARMAAFQERSHSRSIERGATLFASSCTICHGTDGRGSTIAPGLNNPQFFGHDFGTGALYEQIVAIDAQLDPDPPPNQTSLYTERESLEIELPTADNARRAEIEARIAEIDALIDPENPDGLPAQRAALQEEYDALAAQMETAIVRGYDPAHPVRTVNVAWEGSLHDFIYTTVFGGRPVSSSYWPQPMPAWGQPTGPLRPDQIEDITNYVLNWDRGDNWTIADLNAVNQFAVEPGIGGGGADVETVDGMTVDEIVTSVASVTGDPARGEALYLNNARTEANSLLGCSTCHEAGIVGPLNTGTWTRVETERLSDPALSGYTAEQYVIESIVNPSAYVVATFTDAMPQDFASRLTVQDVADILAYIRTLTSE